MVHELKIIRHLLENNFFCKIRRKKTNVLGLLTRQWLREKIHSGFNRLSRQWCSFSFFHEGAQIFFFLLADWILILSGRSGPADQKILFCASVSVSSCAQESALGVLVHQRVLEVPGLLPQGQEGFDLFVDHLLQRVAVGWKNIESSMIKKSSFQNERMANLNGKTLERIELYFIESDLTYGKLKIRLYEMRRQNYKPRDFSNEIQGMPEKGMAVTIWTSVS